MILTFGRYKMKSLEWLILTQPGYMLWMQHLRDARGRLALARMKANELINLIRRKPFVVRCQRPKCRNLATRGFAKRGSLSVRWMCSDCEPSDLGDSPHKVSILKDYWDCEKHIHSSRKFKEEDLNPLILDLAHAKGLPKNFGEDEAQQFFQVEERRNPWMELLHRRNKDRP
jgi:hypothetical protein